MESISIWVFILFLVATVASIVFFWLAANKRNIIVTLLAIWMVLQAVLSLSGFYQNTEAFPPRFIFLLTPGILFIVALFFSKNGKTFIDGLNIKWLTILHIVRIPVEIVLFYVYMAGLIPIEMTFDGYNLDIFSGLSAPVIFYLTFKTKKTKRWLLASWNILCLGLLLNVLTIAVLSAETPFQKIAMDQPNIGVTYFPFVWLPTVIVPIVLISQLAGIRKAIKNKL